MKYAVTLLNNEVLNFFVNGEKPFTLEEAKDFIASQERMYPDNKGYYKIVRLEEVQE